MDLSRYAKHLRGAAIDLKAIVADNMRVMGPRIQGFARKAMPKRTGLLSRAMVTSTTADSLTLESAAISGPAYKGTGKRGTGGALVKYVADYAAERGTPQALQAMEWGQRQFVRLTRAAIRKRINSTDKPQGPANG